MAWRVREATRADAGDWTRMRNALVPSDDHPGEIAAFFDAPASTPLATFIAERADGSVGGFVEVGTRPYAEGCDSSPVGYLEMWFVEEDLRLQGVGAALVRAAEEWARAQGCTEMASDAVLENEGSHAAHRALGYEEVERIVCFRRAL